MPNTNNLSYYFTQVCRKAGLIVPSSWPTSFTDEQTFVLDCINGTLRYLNNKHSFIFKETEYSLTTSTGVKNYNLAASPYNQTMWRVNRLARNAVIRDSDEIPLTYMDYSQLDLLHPSSMSNNKPSFYSTFGENLVLAPPCDGSIVRVRYYSMHIGTDAAGTTNKLRLSASDDLTMMNDEWEDVLVVGAAMNFRSRDTADEKFLELKKQWEDWESILEDMGNQSGEEAIPEFVIQPYIFTDTTYQGRYYPFFTDVPGS